MKLEDQVATLEQCRKLVKLGVVLDTKIVWLVAENHNPDQKPVCLDYKHWSYSSCYNDYISILAPNVAELGVLLPKEPLIEDYLCELVLDKFGDDCWDVGYRQIRTDGKYKKTYCLINEGWETEAQARAEALIWLIENDFVKVENLKL